MCNLQMNGFHKTLDVTTKTIFFASTRKAKGHLLVSEIKLWFFTFSTFFQFFKLLIHFFLQMPCLQWGVGSLWGSSSSSGGKSKLLGNTFQNKKVSFRGLACNFVKKKEKKKGGQKVKLDISCFVFRFLCQTFFKK